jgi:hypothetical protein
MTTKKSPQTEQPTQLSNLPYLAIRNWNKFQQQSKTGKLAWCKLYAAQADDIEYQRLTTFERGVLHDAYLVVTRTGRNLHADLTWFARTTNTLPRYHARLTHAIQTLITRRFLTPTASENPFVEERRIRGEKEEKKNEKESESANSQTRIPFSSKPPDGATGQLMDDDRHVGWKMNDGTELLFEETA